MWVGVSVGLLVVSVEDARWTMPLLYGTERGLRPHYGPAGIRASRGAGTLQARCPCVLDVPRTDPGRMSEMAPTRLAVLSSPPKADFQHGRCSAL